MKFEYCIDHKDVDEYSHECCCERYTGSAPRLDIQTDVRRLNIAIWTGECCAAGYTK